MSNKNTIQLKTIKSKIHSIRGKQVIIDRDLAELYQVTTKSLNQAVKRNRNRFPIQFMFQLTDKEKEELVTKCDQLKILKHSSSNPYAFTEQGVAMLSAVLRSKIAIEVSVEIMNAFVEMRRFLINNAEIFYQLENTKQKLIEHDKKIEQIFEAIDNSQELKEQGIFFDGQIFDAYKFVSDLIRKAKKKIILIDNYIDDTVLTLLIKRRKGVKAIIYTKKITKTLQLDLDKHNQQYSPIEIKEIKNFHDRFLIIDEKEVYLIGASLKDLGKKVFAFSKIDIKAIAMLSKLKGKK